METLYLLIPMALVLIALIVAALWWATRSGQFDDLDSPAMAVVMDDDSVKSVSKPNKPEDSKPA